MGSIKSEKEKMFVVKAKRQNRRVPVFVVAKTNRKVMTNSRQRNWRRRKIKMQTKLKKN
ncbi:50S ribosomal protein L39e [Candidatus Micrarchaeota archaeon]|nr:50S ribosomal protein L39e [Candidatus Micrarchaeota archaeon]